MYECLNYLTKFCFTVNIDIMFFSFIVLISCIHGSTQFYVAFSIFHDICPTFLQVHISVAFIILFNFLLTVQVSDLYNSIEQIQLLIHLIIFLDRFLDKQHCLHGAEFWSHISHPYYIYMPQAKKQMAADHHGRDWDFAM